MSEQQIFLDALPKDAEQRAVFLDGACRDNPRLRQRVEALLASHERAGRFLESSAVGMATVDFAPLVEGPGTVIGPYKLLQQIGEGGFGVVYMAEQQQPVRRKVALKIIKPGMDTKEVIARFESERQALALMDHPNIARVLDAGATDTGRPFFVMELVKGVLITDFADKNRLTVEQRLSLFVSICRAVQHAHQKGVIHRDLKPSNIMVTLHDGLPVPKVIDFGVAKATSQQLTQKTLFTAYGQMIGTPVYMSPEQAEMSGLDIDTRSDIYSLGVLLYELLTGTTPLEHKRLREAGFVEMQRLIREEKPPRPSTRFSTLGGEATALAGNRGTDARRLGEQLSGDLDWIVMKSLEKDRNRRYETPSAFAADIERFLNHEAILARPPSTVYRLKKIIERNKGPAAVLASIAALLVLGTASSTTLAILRNNERDRALAAEQEAKQHLVKAEEHRKAAAQAEAVAAGERDKAIAAREELRGTLYAAEMNLLQTAWNSHQYSRVAQLLDEQSPAAGEPDLRGFEWHYWRRRLNLGRISTLTIPSMRAMGYYAGGTPIFFTRDGSKVVQIANPPQDRDVAAEFDIVTIHDTASGRELQAFQIFPKSGIGRSFLMRLAINDNAERIAVCRDYQQGEICVFDGGTGEKVISLEGLGSLRDLKLSPDGCRLAAAFVAVKLEEKEESRSASNFVKVWNTSTGELVSTLPAIEGLFTNLLWSPDGSKLLRHSGLRFGALFNTQNQHVMHLVDAASGEQFWKREDGATQLTPRAWSHDGRLLAVAEAVKNGEPAMQLWDATTGQMLATARRPTMSAESVANVFFSPDDSLLAHASETEVHVWQVPALSGKENPGANPIRIGPPHLILRHRHPFRALAFGPDSRRLLTIVNDAIVTWDVTRRERVIRGSDNSREFLMHGVFSDDARRAALSTRSGTAEKTAIWDLQSNQKRCDLEAVEDGLSSSSVFTPDGTRVATVGSRRRIEAREKPLCVWIHDASTGRSITKVQAALAKAFLPFRWTIAFRPGGAELGALIHPEEAAEAPLLPRLLTWDLATGEERWSIDCEPSAQILGYTPDGANLVVGSWKNNDWSVAFHDASTGQVTRSYTVGGRPLSLHFSTVPRVTSAKIPARPGESLAAGTLVVQPGNDLLLYDLDTGELRHRLRGINFADRLALSPDGRRLALGVTRGGANDSEISLWSVESGRRLLTLESPARVDSLAFSADGNQLLAVFLFGDGREPVEIWDATPLPEVE